MIDHGSLEPGGGVCQIFKVSFPTEQPILGSELAAGNETVMHVNDHYPT